ncbi:hypothetical protein ACFYNY_34685 [Streptomyces sp. NPDC006530]|uniref:hypothetical protein n=1 Tax=Streptomyces sp. NPDC006530 TaxID=3364750 RepID=UPI0036B2B41E
MAIDHAKRQRMQEAAEERLRQRYGAGRNYVDPLRVMQEVRAQAFGYHARKGEETPDVPVEDLLAALTLVEDARARLDALEQDLIRGARNRAASWQKVADALGMANRQAAEARSTRLERAAQSHSRDRDVPTQRRNRARQRTLETWCHTHDTRIRIACERLVDVAAAWPQLTADELAAYALHALHALGSQAESDNGVKRVEYLEMIGSQLAPYGRPPLEPTGERAAEAAKARDAALALLAELSTVRMAADEARLSTKQ